MDINDLQHQDQNRTRAGCRPRNDDPLPLDSFFPMAEEGMENLRAKELPSIADTALDKQETRAVVSLILLPAMDALAFMGLDEPDIRVLARWNPHGTETETKCPIVTHGRVQIVPFSVAFIILCRTVNLSTTAHRRYKKRFNGERIHITLDADQNAARMYMPDMLRDALDEGWKAWMHGR